MQIQANPVHWFEIPVQNLERAQIFYEAILGNSLRQMDQGAIKMAWFPRSQGTEGSTGGLIQDPNRSPSKTGTLVYLTVSDIDKALENVVRSGGKIALPRASGDYGCIAHFEDTEGNLVALYQAK